MLDAKKLSSKINYDNLDGLFSGCAPAQAAKAPPRAAGCELAPRAQERGRRAQAQARGRRCGERARSGPARGAGQRRQRGRGPGARRAARRGRGRQQRRPGHAAAAGRARGRRAPLSAGVAHACAQRGCGRYVAVWRASRSGLFAHLTRAAAIDMYCCYV